MRRSALVAALLGVLPGILVVSEARAAECAQSNVLPVITQPKHNDVAGAQAPVTIRGVVSKPASCTTPTFTHVNLEIYRKLPATSGNPLQPFPGWGDVKLQNGQFSTEKKLIAGAYLIKARLVRGDEAGTYWGATATRTFTVAPGTSAPKGSPAPR